MCKGQENEKKTTKQTWVMQKRNTAGGWPLQSRTSHDPFSSLAKKQREFHPFAFFRSP